MSVEILIQIAFQTHKMVYKFSHRTIINQQRFWSRYFTNKT